MKNILKIFIGIIALILCFSSCITSRQTNLMQDISKPEYETIPPPEEYRIIPGDQLQIAVYVWDDIDTKELFKSYNPRAQYERRNRNTTASVWDDSRSDTESVPITYVYADGSINFPYIGKIHVQDLTLLETRKLIDERLKAISETASVNVTLYNNFFSVLGEAGARRIDMSKTSMTIYQALSHASNLGDYTSRSNVNIIRQTKRGTIVKTFDLRSKDIINTEFYYVQPNDVIYFPQVKGKFFGASTSFTGFFGLLTSFATIIVLAFRIF